MGIFFLNHFEHLNTTITENGGVITYLKKENKSFKFIDKFLVSDDEIKKIDFVSKGLIKEFGDDILSADSKGRITDRAIDLEYLKKDINRARDIEDYLREHEINFTHSNVHLNFWCGEINKYKAMTTYLNEININPSSAIFFGDSLNDESVFENLDNTVGVSNVDSILGRLNYKPKTILKGKNNKGVNGVYKYLNEIL